MRIILTRKWCVLSNAHAIKDHRTNHHFTLELTKILGTTPLELGLTWNNSINEKMPPYLVVVQAVLLVFVFFEQKHLPLKKTEEVTLTAGLLVRYSTFP